MLGLPGLPGSAGSSCSQLTKSWVSGAAEPSTGAPRRGAARGAKRGCRRGFARSVPAGGPLLDACSRKKPPRRYPSGFCNLLGTDRDQALFPPILDLRFHPARRTVPGLPSMFGTGFPQPVIEQNTARTRLLLRNAIANRSHDSRTSVVWRFLCCFDAYQCIHCCSPQVALLQQLKRCSVAASRAVRYSRQLAQEPCGA